MGRVRKCVCVFISHNAVYCCCLVMGARVSSFSDARGRIRVVWEGPLSCATHRAIRKCHAQCIECLHAHCHAQYTVCLHVIEGGSASGLHQREYCARIDFWSHRFKCLRTGSRTHAHAVYTDVYEACACRCMRSRTSIRSRFESVQVDVSCSMYMS